VKWTENPREAVFSSAKVLDSPCSKRSFIHSKEEREPKNHFSWDVSYKQPTQQKHPAKKSCEKAVTHFRYPFLIAAQQAVKLKNRLSGSLQPRIELKAKFN
jgi:hypothetical protein